jgi:hypothetical protein
MSKKLKIVLLGFFIFFYAAISYADEMTLTITANSPVSNLQAALTKKHFVAVSAV